MAKAKAKTNKSEMIRAALTASPNKPAAEIAKENGVTIGLVYNVKAGMKKKSGSAKGKRGRKPGSKTAAKATAPVGAHEALDAAFEFMTKIGIPFWCFHDTDLTGDGHVSDIENRLAEMVAYAKEKQAASGVKLLWGTANVFSNPKYKASEIKA